MSNGLPQPALVQVGKPINLVYADEEPYFLHETLC